MVWNKIQNPPNEVKLSSRENFQGKLSAEAAILARPVEISTAPSTMYFPMGARYQNCSMAFAKMEKSKIYPQSLVMVSNPFIMEASIRVPRGYAGDVSVFLRCVSLGIPIL